MHVFSQCITTRGSPTIREEALQNGLLTNNHTVAYKSPVVSIIRIRLRR